MNQPNLNQNDLNAMVISTFEDIADRANAAIEKHGANSMIGLSIIANYKNRHGKVLYYDRKKGKVCVDYNLADNGN
jgi:hypothetical protein